MRTNRFRRVEELVDWRADYDNHDRSPVEHLELARKLEPAGRQDLGEKLGSARFEEGHLAEPDPLERGLGNVKDADPQAGLGEGQAQRQPNMSPATEDDEVELSRR